MYNSPLEQFQLVKLLNIKVIGFDLSITNGTLALMLGMLIPMILMTWALERRLLVPNNWQLLFENLLNELYKMVKETLGTKGTKYYIFILTLFVYILVLNMFGIIPYSYSITAQVIMTLYISISIWLGVTILGILKFGFDYFSMFMPPGSPLILAPLLVMIEILSYFARGISLGVRLAANITSGHILLGIISGFGWNMLSSGTIWSIVAIFPIVLLYLLGLLELGVGVVQAYVFSLLATIYLNDTLELH